MGSQRSNRTLKTWTPICCRRTTIFRTVYFTSELDASKGSKIGPEWHNQFHDKSAHYEAEYRDALALSNQPHLEQNHPGWTTEIECRSIVSSSCAVNATVSRSDRECCRCHSLLVLVPDLLLRHCSVQCRDQSNERLPPCTLGQLLWLHIDSIACFGYGQ
jgi:hypothetical protein